MLINGYTAATAQRHTNSFLAPSARIRFYPLIMSGCRDLFPLSGCKYLLSLSSSGDFLSLPTRKAWLSRRIRKRCAVYCENSSRS